jgi:HPt (histidine-containing phosphotransfer) domain-containing protein
MTQPFRAADRTPIRSELPADEWGELLCLFAETLPEKRQTLLDLRRKGAVEEIRVWAHQLKGAGGGYGFPGLSQAAARLEEACRANDARRLSQAADELLDYIDRIDVSLAPQEKP